MGERHIRLTTISAKAAPKGRHGDGRGLYLVKTTPDKGYWVLRFQQYGRRRDMGLGGFPDVTLKQARLAADKARAIIEEGDDPITVRAKANADATHLFEAIAKDAFETEKTKLRGEGKNGRWLSPLTHHVFPHIGSVPVNKIDQIVIRDCLKKIWHNKRPTASKAMDRINITMKHAAALGIDVDLQAVAKAKRLLGVQDHEVKGIPWMPYMQVPTFYESITAQSIEEQSPTKLLLRMLILCGVRTKAVRFMNESEIEEDIWTAPAAHLKGSKSKTVDFRVPITIEMRNVMEACEPFKQNGYFFAGPQGKPISDVSFPLKPGPN